MKSVLKLFIVLMIIVSPLIQANVEDSDSSLNDDYQNTSNSFDEFAYSDSSQPDLAVDEYNSVHSNDLELNDYEAMDENKLDQTLENFETEAEFNSDSFENDY